MKIAIIILSILLIASTLTIFKLSQFYDQNYKERKLQIIDTIQACMQEKDYECRRARVQDYNALDKIASPDNHTTISKEKCLNVIKTFSNYQKCTEYAYTDCIHAHTTREQ